jgi:hypothetical protein
MVIVPRLGLVLHSVYYLVSLLLATYFPLSGPESGGSLYLLLARLVCWSGRANSFCFLIPDMMYRRGHWMGRKVLVLAMSLYDYAIHGTDIKSHPW